MSCGCIKREEIERLIDDFETKKENVKNEFEAGNETRESAVMALDYCIERLKELGA